MSRYVSSGKPRVHSASYAVARGARTRKLNVRQPEMPVTVTRFEPGTRPGTPQIGLTVLRNQFEIKRSYR